MKKDSAENIKNSLPSLISNVGNYLKGLISIQVQKDNISNASGTIGFFISLFGKPLINEYFKKISKSKLERFGFNTYLKAAFSQTYKSLETIKSNELVDSDLAAVTLGVEKFATENIDKLEKELTVLVFQPKYHPAVVFIKEFIIKTFISLQIPITIIQTFRKDFNNGIEETVYSEFGDDYESHKKTVEKFWFEENETKMLLDCISQSRIGFSSDEELKYEESFGYWQPLFKDLHEETEDYLSSNAKLERIEKDLLKVDDLIDIYFSNDSDSHLEKILFVVADFGKGKSTFVKNYAANLARKYLETAEGYIPIYFNLRNFANYSHESQLGIIEDYLQSQYAIKINSEYFVSKKYCFLFDSLDESCDLGIANIEKVISSIKRIQNLDKTKYRTNKIIITSRPFDYVLYNQISSHKPHAIEIENRAVGHYISLYGFKKNQFNDWIFQSLSKIKFSSNINSSDGVIKNILTQISQGNRVDFYDLLLNNRTLSASELRRPIFAYMIYKLITNNINITKTGKIGIYLSFLNLLSKEAKYIYDPNYQISLLEQFEAEIFYILPLPFGVTKNKMASKGY